MNTDSACPVRGTKTTGRTTALASILFVSAGWSMSANGAANSIADAYEKHQNFDTPTVELLIDLVDLPGDKNDLGLTENLEPAEASGDSSVPFLYLTPRVESMLSGVFDEESTDSDSTIPDSQDRTDTDEIRDSSFPPIAEGNADRSTLPGLEETEISKDDVRAMPRFQHHMYRTDI